MGRWSKELPENMSSAYWRPSKGIGDAVGFAQMAVDRGGRRRAVQIAWRKFRDPEPTFFDPEMRINTAETPIIPEDPAKASEDGAWWVGDDSIDSSWEALTTFLLTGQREHDERYKRPEDREKLRRVWLGNPTLERTPTLLRYSGRPLGGVLAVTGWWDARGYGLMGKTLADDFSYVAAMVNIYKTRWPIDESDEGVLERFDEIAETLIGFDLAHRDFRTAVAHAKEIARTQPPTHVQPVPLSPDEKYAVTYVAPEAVTVSKTRDVYGEYVENATWWSEAVRSGAEFPKAFHKLLADETAVVGMTDAESMQVLRVAQDLPGWYAGPVAPIEFLFHGESNGYNQFAAKFGRPHYAAK